MIIRAITKSSKRVLDIYTVYCWNGECLTLSSNPNSAQGVSQWSEYYGLNDSHFEEAAESKNKIIPGTDEKLINFFSLSSVLQSHIEKRISDFK